MTAHSPHNEWNELDAARRSESVLADVMMNGAPKCATAELDRIKRDAIRAMVVGLPDPQQVARRLETVDPQAAETLRQAWISNKQPYARVWRVADDKHAPLLRSLGLIGWISKDAGCAVGNFGLLVRRALIGEDEGEEL